jgi:hypothetical protein
LRTITSVEAKQMKCWKGCIGQQSGDAAKLARALITMPARRSRLGASLRARMPLARQQTDAYREAHHPSHLLRKTRMLFGAGVFS